MVELEGNIAEVFNLARRSVRSDIESVVRRFLVAAAERAERCAGGKRVLAVADVDGVARRVSRCGLGIAAVEIRHCAARDGDGVVRAVVLLVGRRRRAGAGRPAAVDVRMRAAGDGDLVVRRRVARLGAAAPGVCDAAFRDGDRRPRSLEGVGVADDVGRECARFAHIKIRLARAFGVQRGLRLMRVRDIQPRCIVHERRRIFRRRAVRLDARQRQGSACRAERQHGSSRSCIRVEFQLLEARDAARAVRSLDVQRVARAICLRAARDRARDICAAVQVDRIVVRRRAVAACDGADRGIGEADGIFRRVAARRASAVDITHRAARDIDGVFRRVAVC